jgi:hypothetical protein
MMISLIDTQLEHWAQHQDTCMLAYASSGSDGGTGDRKLIVHAQSHWQR